MRRHLAAITFSFVASTALSGAALSADLTPEAEYDWTGFYVGGHIGYGEAYTHGKYTGEFGENFKHFGDGEFDLDPDGILGGVQGGYNLQNGHFVLGIEGDFSFVDWNDRIVNVQNERVEIDTDYLGTLRLRAGYAMNRLLVFGTAGAAWTNTDFEVNDHDNDTAGREKGHRRLDEIGLAVGGGGEYAIDEHWSIKADALYLLFDDRKKISGLTHDTEPNDFIKLNDAFVGRVGVNFHFD